MPLIPNLTDLVVMKYAYPPDQFAKPTARWQPLDSKISLMISPAGELAFGWAFFWKRKKHLKGLILKRTFPYWGGENRSTRAFQRYLRRVAKANLEVPLVRSMNSIGTSSTLNLAR